jgi:hypothetical protein
VAAGLPAGGAVAQEIARHDYDVTALVIPGSDPELAGAALAALLTSSPRSSTVTSTGAIRNYPWSPDGLRHSPPLRQRPHQVDTSVSAEGRYELRGVIRTMRRPLSHR